MSLHQGGSISNFRFPDLEGNPDGTLDESKGLFCSGFRMREFASFIGVLPPAGRRIYWS